VSRPDARRAALELELREQARQLLALPALNAAIGTSEEDLSTALDYLTTVVQNGQRL
jgi:hypothetical protein